MIDFDSIDDWAPKLTDALSQCVPDSIREVMAGMSPEFVEDSKATLLALAPRDAVIAATLDWVRSDTIAAYHGSRLTEADIESIRKVGLKPLDARDRGDRLLRALSRHPHWAKVEYRLSTSLQAHGAGNRAGHREGQVHLTLSRVGLTEGFSHYLTGGSEFDQQVASDLLGQEGLDLLARDGTPTVVQLAIPGERALDGAHRHFNVEDMLRRGDVPNVVDSFLEAWSYRLSYPSYQSRTRKLDCGICFNGNTPVEWLASIKPHASSTESAV
jgi:hypothetical protein